MHDRDWSWHEASAAHGVSAVCLTLLWIHHTTISCARRWVSSKVGTLPCARRWVSSKVGPFCSSWF